MANITRIKNNQITDSTITYTKLAEGTLVGSVFNPNLTLNSNVTILGNLTIAGTPTTIQSTNTYVNDPLVVFNNGYVGSPSYDIGMIANRNLQTLAGYGSVNTAFIWKETDSQWQAVATTETGATTGSINNSGWANVRVGNLISVSSNVTGALVVGGAASITGSTTLTGALTFTTASGGGVQAVAIGNVTPGSGAFTSLSSSTTYTLNTGTAASLQALAIGNVSAGTGAFTTLTASGATTVTDGTQSTSKSTGALVVTGGAGVGGALYAGTVFDDGNRVVTGVTSSGSGNVTIGGSAPSLTVGLTTVGPGASTWGGATQIPSITVDVYGRVITAGNTALNTVAVTNLGNTSEITANASVGLVGLNLTTTGVTPGNYGNASVIPTIVVDSKGRVTSITTNTASTTFTVAGTSGSTDVSASETITLTGTYGVTVTVGDTYANISTPQDLRSTANPTFNNLTTASVQGAIGNVTPNTGAFTTVTTGGLQAVAIGNVTPGSGAFTTATTGGLQAVAIGNVTPGTGAFTTLTAQTETVGGLQAVAIGNVTPGTGAFTTLTAQTETVGGLQAVAIGNVTPGSGAFTTGSFSSTLDVTGATTMTTATTGGLQAVAIGNVTPGSGAFTTLTASGATTATATTESTNTTTGALVVSGGVGVAKNLNVGGSVVITGNLTVQGDVTTVNTATLDVEDLNVTVAKGAASAAAANGGGLTVDGANATFTYANADDSWNVNKLLNINNSTGSTSTTTGALVVDGGAGIAQNLYVGGLIQADTASFASINNTPIGNTTPSTGAFTTLSAQTETVGGLQAVAIGNVTPGTGAFTTLTASGLQATAIGNVTPGTAQFTTLGASGATTLNTATAASLQAVAIGNVTPGSGAFTTLSAQTETVGGLQAVAIGNVTPGTGAFTSLSSSTTYTLNTGTAASLQAVAIGNVTPGTGAFTSVTVGETSIGDGTVNTGTVTAGTGNLTYLNVGGASALNTVTSASLQATAIGNVTPGTGAFTTLTTTGVFVSSGNLVAAATTPSTTVNTGSLITKGGVGIVGNVNAGGNSGTGTHTLWGNVALGPGLVNPTTTASTLTINENTSQVLDGNFSVHVSGTDATNASYGVDSFGTGVVSVFMGRHARGTAASPTAVQLNDTIGGVEFRGYGTTGFSSNSPAGMYAIAKENFTDSAQGVGLSFDVVPLGSTTGTSMAYLGTDGNLLLRSTTPSIGIGTGALVVKGGAGVAGNLYVGSNTSITGELRINAFTTSNSGAQFASTISTLSTTDTNAPGVGSIITAGGISAQGNAYVGKSIYIGPASFDRAIASASIIGVNNGTNYAQSAMINTAGSGSSDFAAYTANGSDAGGWVDMGIAGNVFSDPLYSITKPQDGYLFTRPTDDSAGGNIIIGTSEAGSHNDVVIGIGSFLEESEVARFHGNASTNGTFVLSLPTDGVPAADSGALQVVGGASIGGNAYVGGALTVNGSQTANYDFKVAGKNTKNLVWARPSASYDQVIVGNTIGASSLVGGAKLIVNSTDSILLPSGTSGNRPSNQGFTDVEGMFRYNTTLGAIEWYTGAVWQTATTTFTIITDEQFNGDGSTVDFTLAAATTTAGTIVSINGVVQIPTLAYSITGVGSTTLTFTEAPAIGDIIDVRRLTTTQTLFGVASPNGKMAFQTDNNGVYIYTGPTGGTSTPTISWNANGYTVNNVANVSVSSANTATTIVTIDNTLYRSAKIVIQATHGTDYQVSEALVISDGTAATIVSYGLLQTNGNLGIVTATQSGTDTLVQFIASNSSTIVRVKPDLMTI